MQPANAICCSVRRVWHGAALELGGESWGFNLHCVGEYYWSMLDDEVNILNIDIVGVTFFALTDITLRNFSPGQGFDRYHIFPKVRKFQLEVYPLHAATLLLSHKHRD